jgi:hypothetical protein
LFSAACFRVLLGGVLLLGSTALQWLRGLGKRSLWRRTGEIGFIGRILERNFYRLPFTPPSLVRHFDPSVTRSSVDAALWGVRADGTVVAPVVCRVHRIVDVETLGGALLLVGVSSSLPTGESKMYSSMHYYGITCASAAARTLQLCSHSLHSGAGH